MRSKARLTYEQVQAAADGDADDVTAPLTRSVIEPLYGAFGALLEAREKRGTLDLEVPEVQIRLDRDGRPIGARSRARLDSHRLIEEMMIAANVAAAETLEQASAPCMYRVHDRPDPVKIEALVQLLDSLGLARGRGVLAKPKDLTRLIRAAREPGAGPAGQHAWCCARRARPPTARTISAISASISAATPISPRRSGATPIWWCIAP